MVVDVIEKDGRIYISAADMVHPIYYQIECTDTQLKRLLDDSPEMAFDAFAFVLSLASVHKPVAQIVGEIDVDTAMIVHESSDIVVIKGQCVDLLHLGHVGLIMDDLVGPR
jgi:hypothetical protein